ncbi:diguanylate cyclase [Reinekea forsetii]|nr:diguanylate cyclase [Reinekea forsetii]
MLKRITKKLIGCFILPTLFLGSAVFSEDLESVSLKLKWQHQFQFAGYYAAIEKGFYREAGFDVTLIEHDGSSDLYDPIINNEIEFGTADSSLVARRLKGDPLVVLTTVYQHSPSVLISLKEKGVLGPFELKGKRIMFQRNADDAALQALLISLGIQESDYEFVPHSFNKLALLQDEPSIDVMSAYLSNEPFLFKEKGHDVQIIDPANYGIDFYGDLLYSTEDYIKQSPDRAIAFKDASLRGWRYALDNPEEVFTWLQTKYPSGKSLAALEYEAEIIKKMVAQDFVQLGSMYPARFSRIADVYKQLGLAPKSGDISGLTLDEYLKQKSDTSKQYLRALGIVSAILISLIALLVIGMRSMQSTIKKRTSQLFELNKDLTRQIELSDKHVISATIGSNGLFKEVSTAFCQLAGYSRQELLCIDPEQLTPPGYREGRNEIIHRVFAGSSEHGEIRQINKDGSSYWLHMFADPIRDENGNINAIQITATDVTEKKLVQRLSETDVLTDIANRKKLDSTLKQEWARYIRYKEVFSIIVLDLDHFKSINDNFGHPEGDRVLKAVADAITLAIRNTDLVGRWGGEEFLVILPLTPIENAVHVAEKLRMAITRLDGFPMLDVSASFGVASSDQVIDLDNLFRIADAALYTAKESGRNCVRAAD